MFTALKAQLPLAQLSRCTHNFDQTRKTRLFHELILHLAQGMPRPTLTSSHVNLVILVQVGFKLVNGFFDGVNAILFDQFNLSHRARVGGGAHQWWRFDADQGTFLLNKQRATWWRCRRWFGRCLAHFWLRWRDLSFM